MPLIEQPRALGGEQPRWSSAELGSPNAAPPSPLQGRGSVPTHTPGRHAVPGCPIGAKSGHNPELGKAPPLDPPRWAVAEPARGQLKTTYSIIIFFFKHMLIYENNHPGTVQAYTDKSTLRHEGLPKE